MNDNLARFLRYVKIDTQSDDTTHTTPSSEKQKDLGRLLVKELLDLGLNDAYMDEWGNVYAHLKGEGDLTIGLNAHMDTALEVTDTNVNPRVIKNYDGNDILLNDKYVLSSTNFPRLSHYIGSDLVVTDGNTLLGADDKAGIGIIMSALAFLKAHKDIKHTNIALCFTVDEEIGEGPLHFSLDKMKADYAYTIDGSSIDCIDYENFNAKSVTLKVDGVSIHPGEGKGALINALLLINEFINKLPKNETPFDSEDDQGYWHINSIEGSSDSATLNMILRSFYQEEMVRRVNDVNEAVSSLIKEYPKAKFGLQIKDQYWNMKPFVEQKIEVIKRAENALIKNGLTPKHTRIRGGTDGATFSKMGLITPNLGTGSYNHHGRYEYLVVNEYEKMIQIVVDILKI